MMKPIVFFYTMVTVVLLIIGCGKSRQQAAEDALCSLLDATKAGNFDIALEYIDLQSLAKSMGEEYSEEWIAEIKKKAKEDWKYYLPYLFTVFENTNYEIIEVKDLGNNKGISFRVKLTQKVVGSEDAETNTNTFIMKKLDAAWKIDYDALELL